jgi:hypothetical protein
MAFARLSVVLTFLLVLWANMAQAEVNRDLYGPYRQILEQLFLEINDQKTTEGININVA